MKRQPSQKRCGRCKKLLGSEHFNHNKRSKDGLASTCRACVNRRRRELHRRSGESATAASGNLSEAARRGQLDVVRTQVSDDPRQLEHLLWETVRDFHTIKKRPEHAEQARFLIQRGAQPHWSMICEAARGGHLRLIDILLESGVETNVFVAAATGDLATMCKLLEGDCERAKSDHDSLTPLHYCAMSALGKRGTEKAGLLVSCAERLIGAGAEMEAKAEIDSLRSIRPLHCVCWTGGNIALARVLLERGANPTGCLRFALGHFHRHGDGHYEIAELLLRAGIDIHDEGDAVLGRFAAHGDAKAVRWLLEHGANPNVRSAEGWTPLHHAAERNTGTQVVQLLMEYGADVRATTIDDHTPLDLSRQHDKQRVAETLQSVAVGVTHASDAVPRALQTYIDGLKTHDISKVAGAVSEDLAFVVPGGRTLNKSQFLGMLRALYKAFPDWHYEHDPPEIRQAIIAIRWRQQGTHSSTFVMPDLEPVQATGRIVTIPAQYFFYKVRHDGIVEIRPAHIPGGAPTGILAQIGVTAAPL